MHLFGDVRRRVIDDDSKRGRRGHYSESLIVREIDQLTIEECCGQGEIQESWPGNLYARHVNEVDSLNYLFGNVARRASEPFSEGHDPVRLVVAPVRRAQHGIGTKFECVEGRLQAR